MKRIYLDYAATTPVDKEVLEEMLPYFTEHFENPSALYSQKIKLDIENARKQIALFLAVKPSEIIFTSGGTEANNLAILGLARQYEKVHFITSTIEHDSVLQVFAQLEKEGHSVTYLSVDKTGKISMEQLIQAIRPNTKLISIMTVNNEIGTIQEIEKIGKLAKEHNIIFHTDAVQAIGQTEIKGEYADLISLSSHKVYGPKGVGALYVAKGIKLQPLFFGGYQESGKRSGTENVTGIIGFGKAMELMRKHQEQYRQQQKKCKDYLLKRLLTVEGVRLNGSVDGVSGISHFSVEKVSTELLLTRLDLAGICVSAGSACQAGSYRVSHVMKAIGDEGSGHLRISIGKDTTEDEIDRFVKIFTDIVQRLR